MPMLIPRTELKGVRRLLGDDEYACVVCRKPIKTTGHKFFVWMHLGGSHVVTKEEGEHLNATGHAGADLGGQPVGRCCLKKFPELKPYLIREEL